MPGAFNMKVEELLARQGAWLSPKKFDGTIISSRLRLARNIRGVAFPGWAGARESASLCEEIRNTISSVQALRDAEFLHTGDLDGLDKLVLHERQLLSPELMERDNGSGVFITPDQRIVLMINEEDHIRLQVISPGMDLMKGWEMISSIDDELEEVLEYAFSPELGYLTACPTNVGTGLRASVMMHLPGMHLMKEIDPMIRGLNKMGYAVRGISGEGSEAFGNMFQISNQMTLGYSEESIIQSLTIIVDEVKNHENNARDQLMDDKQEYIRDYVGRSMGVLLHAHLLSSKEALDLLSAFRLGLEIGMLSGIQIPQIDELMLLTQAGHLQKIEGKVLSPDHRDRARARVIRERLKDALMY